MAKRVTGITVEINGDTTNLSKALAGVDKNIKNTQSKLRDVEKLLKLDPTNTELLAQKQKLLGEAVKDTKEKLDSLKTASEAAAKTKDNYDAWKEKITPIKTEISKTSDELKKLKEKSEEANEQLSKGEISQEEYDKIQREIKDTSDKLKDLRQDAKKVSEEFGNPISPEQYNAIQREIIETEQDLQRLQREAENSRTALVEIGKAGEGLQNIGGKISSVGKSLLPVTAGITAIGVAGASSFAEVDKTMQLANKTMGNTAEEAEAVNNAMKEAATNSIYGMDDASNAMLNFARAGLKSEAAISVLTPAMNLAAGEGGELDTVSAGLVATMNSFHASFDEAETYANTFAAACNNSALDINSLCNSMSVAGPIFSAAGYGLKDTAWAMGLMGDAGLDAEVSANSLKTGLARLATATSENDVGFQLSQLGFKMESVADIEAKLGKAQDNLEEKTATLTAKQTKYNEVLAKYGENSSQALTAQAQLVKAENDFEKAQAAVNALTQDGSGELSEFGAILVDEKGNMKPFTEVVKTLQSAFSGLSEQEQLSAASIIFGKNQMAPWLALINTAPERLDELSASLDDGTGLTQEMADTMMSGFGGGIEKLKSSIDVLIYSIGESLAPILQKVIDFVQRLVDKFNALSPAQKETIAKIALIAAAIGPLLIVVGQLVTGLGGMMIVFSKMPAIITKVKGSFTAVKAALSGAVGTMLAVVAIIAVLAAAFKNLWENNEDFRNNITSIWEKIKATFENLTNGIVDRLNALGFDFKDITEVIKAAWDWLCSYLAPIFENTFNFISEILSSAVDIILGIMDFFIGLFAGDWETCWNGVKEIFSGIWDAIKSTLETAFDLICNIFGTNSEDIAAGWKLIWTDIKDFFSNIWTSIKNFFTDTWNSIKDFFVNIWNGFQEHFQIGMDSIKNTFTSAWTSIKNFFVGIWTAISTTVGNIINGIKTRIETVFTAIKNFITAIFTAVHDRISVIWNAVYTTIKPLLDAFRYLFETIFEAIKILIGKAMDWVSDKIQTIWNAIKEFITPILEGIRDFFTNIFNAVKNTVGNVMDWISDKIQTVWNAVNDFIRPILEGIRDFVSDIWDTIKTNISEKLDAIKFIVSNVWENIKSTVSGILDGIKSVVSNVWNTIKNNISEKMDAIKFIVTNIWDNVKSAVSEKITGIKDTIKGGFDEAVNFVKNLADEAWNWGADIISGIVEGIESKIKAITEAVTGVADEIHSYLHFSVPDEGPLTDYESWMPDFMKGLANGINKSKKYLESAISSVAESMQISLNPEFMGSLDSISGAVISGSSGTVNNYYNNDNSRTVNQTNNSPKSLSRLEIYRQTRNALGV